MVNHNLQYTSGLFITILSMGINIALSGGKMAIGVMVRSEALFADGLHSLVDLATDIAVLFGLKMASLPEDENHPYGHHKFTSLCNFFIGFVILLFCGILIYTSFQGLLKQELVIPSLFAISVAFFSTLIKEYLYWHTRIIAKRNKSSVLMANAVHHRLDAFTSLIAFIALTVIYCFGEKWFFLDKIIGLLMGLFIAYEGMKIFMSGCRDLLDEAPDATIINDLREHILQTPGTIAYHHFRVRKIGDMFEVDFHLQVDPNLTVEQGHQIASDVKRNILKDHTEAYNVLIHIEPANNYHLKKAKGIFDKTAP